jgi:hypothetical protein
VSQERPAEAQVSVGATQYLTGDGIASDPLVELVDASRTVAVLTATEARTLAGYLHEAANQVDPMLEQLARVPAVELARRMDVAAAAAEELADRLDRSGGVPDVAGAELRVLAAELRLAALISTDREVDDCG